MGHANIIKSPDIFSHFFLTSPGTPEPPEIRIYQRKRVEAPSTSKSARTEGAGA